MNNSFIFPSIYAAWLHPTNEFQTDSDVMLYAKSHLVERNETHQTATYADGFFTIGDDSGGNVFLMEQRVDATAVWMVDVGDMNPNHATLIASDFASWVSLGCPLPEVEEFASFCDVVLVTVPDGGLVG